MEKKLIKAIIHYQIKGAIEVQNTENYKYYVYSQNPDWKNATIEIIENIPVFKINGKRGIFCPIINDLFPPDEYSNYIEEFPYIVKLKNEYFLPELAHPLFKKCRSKNNHIE